MTRVIEKMGERIRTVAVTKEIDHQLLFTPPQFEGNYDPHVWFDVQMWKDTVKAVEDTLVEMDPANSELFHANADAYRKQLEELNTYVLEQAKRVPVDQRVLMSVTLGRIAQRAAATP